jgi:hypothetical protein
VWQQILKAELASQSGYAQLDFDNIIEEEDDNCRKRWLQLREKVENWARENLSEFESVKFGRSSRYDTDELNNYSRVIHVRHRSKGYNFPLQGGEIEAQYNPNIPEEIYCKALDMLGAKEEEVKIGEYEITRINNSRFNMINIWHVNKSHTSIGLWLVNEPDSFTKKYANSEDFKKLEILKQEFDGVL